MKQTKLSGYQPSYPKKMMRGATLAAAALLAIGTTTGCASLNQLFSNVPTAEPTPEQLVLSGDISVWEPTDEPELEGYVAPETTPGPLDLRTDGIVPIETPIEKPPVIVIPEVPESGNTTVGP